MNIIKIFIASYASFLLLINNVLASDVKKSVTINCHGLPGCPDDNISQPTPGLVWDQYNVWGVFIVEIISTMLQYVSVVAVIALMLSWVLYLVSGWEEEKTKKAKNWIIWSLVWVVVSMSSWFLVNIVNNFSFETPTL